MTNIKRIKNQIADRERDIELMVHRILERDSSTREDTTAVILARREIDNLHDQLKEERNRNGI